MYDFVYPRTAVLRLSLFAVAFFALADCGKAGPQGYSGTVQAPSAAVGSTIGGRVLRVLASDGARVRAGDTIVAFDDSQQRAAYDNAVASARAAKAALADLEAGSRAPDLARAQALARQQNATYQSSRLAASRQIAVLDDQIRQADADVAAARAAAIDATTNLVRERSLYRTGDVSAQSRDAAQSSADRARAQLDAAAAAAAAARATRANAADVTIPRGTTSSYEAYRAARASYESLAIGARPDAVVQSRAQLAAATASVADTKARLDQMTVRAPADGTIAALDLHPGDLVAPGASVATIDEDGEPYVRVYVPQAELGRWHVGASVTVHSDALPGTSIDGTVEAIDANAQFTPQNVETADDRANLVFGVKVRIHDRQQPLHGGTTASVTLP